MHLNHNQLQPQLLIWQQKTVRGWLDSNFANFHLTKFMRNASSKRDATYHDTHTHTHTWGNLTQFICHKLRVMCLISTAATAQTCPAHTLTCHTHHTLPLFIESKILTFTFKELKSHKASDCRKRIIHFWSSRLSAGADLRLQPNEIGWQRQMQIIASCYSRQRLLQRPLQRPVTS